MDTKISSDHLIAPRREIKTSILRLTNVLNLKRDVFHTRPDRLVCWDRLSEGLTAQPNVQERPSEFSRNVALTGPTLIPERQLSAQHSLEEGIPENS